jgi:hypothetical protein
MQDAFRRANRLDQKRANPWHIIIKTTSTETRERTLKAVREKKQIVYKGKIQNHSRLLNRNIKSKKSLG